MYEAGIHSFCCQLQSCYRWLKPRRSQNSSGSQQDKSHNQATECSRLKAQKCRSPHHNSGCFSPSWPYLFSNIPPSRDTWKGWIKGQLNSTLELALHIGISVQSAVLFHFSVKISPCLTNLCVISRFPFTLVVSVLSEPELVNSNQFSNFIFKSILLSQNHNPWWRNPKWTLKKSAYVEAESSSWRQ